MTPTGQQLVENPNDEDAYVGAHETPVNFKLLQEIYNEITGKTEELSNSYEKPYHINFSDLVQLDHKISQMCEQYSIKAKNCNITLYHINDSKLTYSSFESFQRYDVSITKPIINIELKYNFLILLPESKRPQSYDVSISLSSRVSVWKKMQEDEALPVFLMKYITSRTALVSVKYIDYTVASSILHVIDEWLEGLFLISSTKLIKKIQRHSHNFRPISELLFASAIMYGCMYFLSKHGDLLTTLIDQTRFLITALFTTYVGVRCGRFIGAVIEQSIDKWRELSYIEINRGDKIQINKAKKNNTDAILHALMAGTVEITLGIISGVLTEHILH